MNPEIETFSIALRGSSRSAATKLAKRFRGSYFLVSGTAMLIGFPLVWAMTHASFPWNWIYIFLACFCLFFNTAPANTIFANVTHPAMRATGFALNILVIHAFGDVLSPFLIGLISDKYNMDAAFRLVALMFLLSGILWLWGTKYLASDSDRAPHLRLGRGED
jgi:fucose permease